MTTTTIDLAMDAYGYWAVWIPRDFEAPVGAGDYTRYEHASGRDYIPCTTRAEAKRLVKTLQGRS